MSLPTAPPWRQRLEAWLGRRWVQPGLDGWSLLLAPLAACYGSLGALHRAAYTLGLLTAQAAPRPVIVVGNLVAGGAGKTPTVIALIPLLHALGHRPGVVSRGHGRSGQDVQLVTADLPASLAGDEPLLIHLRTGAPVAVGADRVAAAQALCAAHPDITVLLADDGAQHLRLARQAQVLVFDDRGVGNGRLMPAGPLRQPMPAAVPPATLVLYTGGVVSTRWPGFVGQRRLSGVLALADWWRGVTLAAAPPGDGFAALAGRPLLAVAALARPEGFFAMLEGLGLQIDRLPLPDHARFSPLPWPAGTADVIVTEKDAVKLRPDRVGSTRVWVAALDFRPEPGFATALRTLCAQSLPPP